MNLKVILAATVCFGVGAGGGTAWSVKKSATTRAAAMAADSLAAADSTHADPEPGDGEADPTAHGESNGESAATSPAMDSATAHDAPPDSGGAPATTGDTTHGATTAPPADPAHTEPAPANTGTATSADAAAATQKFAGIVVAMKPDEAARVLEPLDDAAVKDVLLAMPEKKAAAILAKFSGERAASLARTMLNRGKHD